MQRIADFWASGNTGKTVILAGVVLSYSCACCMGVLLGVAGSSPAGIPTESAETTELDATIEETEEVEEVQPGRQLVQRTRQLRLDRPQQQQAALLAKLPPLSVLLMVIPLK